MTKKKIGILTGGGDCPGLNAVIRAAARTLNHAPDTEVVGIQFGFEGLLTHAVVPLTGEAIRGILPKGGTLLRTTNRGNPFEYPGPDGTCVDRSAEVVANIHELGIDGIIAIGGDGTLRIAQQLCDHRDAHVIQALGDAQRAVAADGDDGGEAELLDVLHALR